MVIRVQILVDWSRSFVDKNGSLYCFTTDEQKDIAAKIIGKDDIDLWIYAVDVHPKGSAEFSANEGPYGTHNLVGFDIPGYYDDETLKRLGVLKEQTASCRLTQKLEDVVHKLPSGLIVPRHIFFQDYDAGPINKIKAPFTLEDVEKTFGVGLLKPQEFLDGKIKYVINAKHMFDGSSNDSYQWVGHVDGVPDMEMNIFTLLKQMYGLGADIEFNITGVVSGLCVYNTASGLRQRFKRAKINVISDAVTHLLVPKFGLADADTANLVIKKMCQQAEANYITTTEYLGKTA